MKCPRRSETVGESTVFKVPEEDTWSDRNTCSWCGSMNPDEFMRRCEAGVVLTPTDKSYKVYVDPDDGFHKFYFMHLSEEQMKRFVDLYNAKTTMTLQGGDFYCMPYFMRRATERRATDVK